MNNMSKKKQNPALSGHIGGMAVRQMIESVEEQIAAGVHVSAAPSSQDEAKRLEQVKKENQASGQNAKK